MRRLVLLVEGPSDAAPVANLVNRVITDRRPDALGHLFVDARALEVGNVPKLSGRCAPNWQRFVQIAATSRKDVVGLLAVLDGDEEVFEKGPFCAAAVARTLAARAAGVGAGRMFSLAVVILRQEFESLLIAGAAQLPGYDGTALPPDIESAPRDAKRWLNKHLDGGYKESADQLRLTQAVEDFTPLRTLRGFRRFESAVVQLVDAAAGEAAVCTPAGLPPAPPA